MSSSACRGPNQVRTLQPPMSPFPPSAALIPVVLVATILFPAFFTFDALVKREHDFHREAWEADNRPFGMFWRPERVGYRSRVRSGLATNRCMSRWLFRNPAWGREDGAATRLLSRLRWLVLAWNVGVLLLAALVVLSL